MKPLGKFSHITKAGNIVLRSEDIPFLYSAVTDGVKKIGKVQDIIGPAAKPYIVVKPTRALGENDLSQLSKGVFYELKGRRTDFGTKGGVRRGLSGVRKQKPDKGL